ncbi:hypothetical protein LBMAG53_13950 [Planctomycetota bacterium]|nr:hypothetical protein LBMAG53_13950 [Planctomycetota bacterium]
MTRIQRFAAALGSALAVALPATRPLVWDGDWRNAANLVWWTLAVLGLLLSAAAVWEGREKPWRWSVIGLVGAIAALILLPAALRAPDGLSGWATWAQWILLIAYGGWLAQQAPRLVWTGLVVGLAGELFFALSQWAIVLPAMTAANASGELAAFETATGDLAARIAAGGVFGTFTIANTLGAFLILLLPAVVAISVMRTTISLKITSISLGIAVVAVLLLADTKGAWLALIAGGLLAWASSGRWWRFGALAGLLLIAAAAWQTVPAISARLAPSIDVRIGYWQSAVTLIGEAPVAGHGVGGFAAHSGRVMAPGDEPTRLVHNELLEAAVDGGILAGAAVAILLVLLAWRPAGMGAEKAVPPIERSDLHSGAVLLAVLLPYLAMVEGFSSNLGWWPGGGLLLVQVLYATGIGTALAGLVLVAARFPLPPVWAIHAGLAAAAFHALIDFDFHACGHAGTVVALAALAARPVVVAPRLMAPAAALGALILVAAGWWYGLAGSASERHFDDLMALRKNQGKAAGDAVLTPERFDRALGDIGEAAVPDWPLAIRITSQRAPGRERLDATALLALRLPWSPVAQRLHADDLATTGAWDEALLAAEKMEAAAPTDLKVLRHHAALLEAAARAAERTGASSLAKDRLAQAGTIRSRIESLRDRVHPRLR